MAAKKPNAVKSIDADSGDRYAMLADAVRDVAEVAQSALGYVEAAQRAVDWIAQLLPNSRVIALEVAEAADKATVLAVASSPLSWQGASFALDRGSIFGEALHAPGKLFRAARVEAHRAFPWSAEVDPRRVRLVATAFAASAGAPGILAVFVADHVSSEVDRVLRTFAQLLGGLRGNGSSPSRMAAEHAAIARAKQEWECTVDALPQLVCVLGKNRKILRTNRAVETWGLGKVREVQGRDVHALLHAHCDRVNCALADDLASAWLTVGARDGGDFELHDSLLGRVLHVTIRQMSPSVAAGAAAPKDLAVAVIADITELHSIQEDLRLMNEQLETRIGERTSELVASRNELSRLSDQLMKAQEIERKRIAQELHDSIGQSLSAIKYSLERALELTPDNGPEAPRALITTTIGRVQETVDSIRSIAMNLRPSILDDLGAVSALRWFCREFSEVYGDIKIHSDLALDDEVVPESLCTPIFRTVQEALNNIAKHAKAKTVFVSLRTEGSALTLEIRDDGVGFDPKTASLASESAHGLSGMRERAATAGGALTLKSNRRVGTIVRVDWPLPAPGAA
jgi:signal transduction histidine kinase